MCAGFRKPLCWRGAAFVRSVVYVDPTTFGSRKPADEVLKALEMARIPTVVVRKGDPIGSALSQRPQ